MHYSHDQHVHLCLIVRLLRGGGISAILPEAAVLCGFAIVFFVIGIWRFK